MVHVALPFIGSEKNPIYNLLPKSQKWALKIAKQVEDTTSNNSACPTGQRSHVKISKYQIRTAVHSTQPKHSDTAVAQIPRE